MGEEPSSSTSYGCLPTPGLVGIPLCEGSCALAGSVALVMILYGAVDPIDAEAEKPDIPKTRVYT